MTRLLRLPHLGRLGVEELAHDHLVSLSLEQEDGTRRTSRADVVVFFVFPVAVGAAAVAFGLRVVGTEALLTGVAILTGLLFGLLVHVLSIGLRLQSDPRFAATSRVTILVNELRANVSWACAVGLLLTAVLAVAGTFYPDPVEGGLAPWFTGVVAALSLHLALTLLMILKRVRSTYMQLGV